MTLKEETDNQLITLLRAGEQKAIEVLYERYAGLVYSVAFRILQNNSDAEELTQDVFTSLWQKDNYQPDRGSLKTFLGLLVRHRALDRLRKRNSTSDFLQRWEKNIYQSSSSSLPLEKAELIEQKEQLQAALSQIPPQQREILMLNYFEGLSRAQIAEKLNLPVGTVKSRVRLAFVQLKRILIAPTNL